MALSITVIDSSLRIDIGQTLCPDYLSFWKQKHFIILQSAGVAKPAKTTKLEREKTELVHRGS